MTVTALRPATRADSEFCFRLHKATMGDYIAAIWGWDEQVQRGFQDRAFSPGSWQIITANGTDIGMLDVERRQGEIYLSRIEIHPDHQGRGYGTRLIRALIDEAAQRDQDLVLDVLAVNQRALALYQRLCLTEVARHGDGDMKITMRSSHPSRAAARSAD
jgi:ribosomal protein S18 acetylase RimI-like enzyme